MSTMVSIQKKLSFNFSQQEVVDCSWLYGSNKGCFSGSPIFVFNYAKAFSISSEASYPYISGLTGKNVTCNKTISGTGPYKVVSYSSTTKGSCSAILTQLKKTPVVAIINAVDMFYFYSSGIFSAQSCSSVPIGAHAVLLVGVDECNNWKIHNSWGKYWG